MSFDRKGTMGLILFALACATACSDGRQASPLEPIGPGSAVASGPDTQQSPVAAAAGGSSSMAIAQIIGVSGGQCLNVSGNNLNPGTTVITWPCMGGWSSNELWTVPATNQTGEIRVYQQSLCLDDRSGKGTAGAAVFINSCSGAKSQQWAVAPSGQLKTANGTCLTTPNGGTSRGAQAVLAACVSGAGQQWRMNQMATTSAAPPAVTAPQPATPAVPSPPRPMFATGSPAAVLAFMAARNAPSAARLRAMGGAWQKYEDDFAWASNHFWAMCGIGCDGNFYDRAMTHYVQWAMTGDPTYLSRANAFAVQERGWLEHSMKWYPQPMSLQADGIALHAIITGDTASRNAIAHLADAMINPYTYYSRYVGDTTNIDFDSRTQSRLLGIALNAWLLNAKSYQGVDYTARLRDLLNRILASQSPSGAYHWRNQCYVNKPYMTGMVNDALIRYYTTFEPDPRIPAAVKRAVDYMWAKDWIPSTGQFKYIDADCQAKPGGYRETVLPNADLNNMIVSGFAFVAKQFNDETYMTKADAIFKAGVYGVWLSGSKQYNQEYTSSYRYLSLRF